jgi:hypothetical protein
VVKSGCFDIKVAKLMQRVRGKHGRGNFFRGSRASKPSAKLVLQRAPTTSKDLRDNFQHIFGSDFIEFENHYTSVARVIHSTIVAGTVQSF